MIATGSGTTSIYESDGHNINAIVTNMEGELNLDSMTVNGSYFTAYVTPDDSTFSEYAAVTVDKSQVAALSGGSEILALLDQTVGDTNTAAFWHRANGMIQAAYPDGRYVNLYLVGTALSLVPGYQQTSGNPDVVNGQVASGYTVFPQITPSPLPKALSSVETVYEGAPVSYDVNGDGTPEAVTWGREQTPDGLFNAVIYSDGSEVYRTSVPAQNFTVEVCDIDSSSPGYNLIIYATGAAAGSYLQVMNGSSSPAMMISTGVNNILNGWGNFSELSPSGGHIVKNVNGYGTYEINAANPVAGVSGSTYIISLPLTLWGEQVPASMEYDIVKTGNPTFLARDAVVYSAASWGTPTENVLPAGTEVIADKLAISVEEGSTFIYISAPVAGYLAVDPTQPIPILQ